jgi:hypothetical protein
MRDTSAVRRSQTGWLLLLVGLGAILRVILAARSPTPYGYVFDFYHEAIQRLYALGHLPASTDCWQCYHPPLHVVLGLPLYALGKRLADGSTGLADPALRFVSLLSLVCGSVAAYYSYRILRLYRFRSTELVLGTGLILTFPCLFISSYGIEADILVTAIMTAFTYHAIRFFAARNRTDPWPAVRLGVLAGLACATKYTGLVAPASLLVIALVAFAFRQKNRQGDRLAAAGSNSVRRLAIALTICALLGGWKYADNYRRYGQPLFANGSAQLGFSVANRPSYRNRYDFLTLRMKDLIRLARGQVRPAPLTNLPFYRSVWTTMYGMAWGDMSLFSDPSRHGFYRQPYPRKPIRPILATSVLVLGLVPSFLAVAGFLITLRRRLVWPLTVIAALTWIAYVAWFTAQEDWALKTKYILFLLPAYVVFAMFGLRWLRRVSLPAAHVTVALLVLLIASAHLYLLNFAWG